MVEQPWFKSKQYENISKNYFNDDINQTDNNRYIQVGHRKTFFKLKNAKELCASLDFGILKKNYKKVPNNIGQNIEQKTTIDNHILFQDNDYCNKNLNSNYMDWIEWEDSTIKNNTLLNSKPLPKLIKHDHEYAESDILEYEKPFHNKNSFNIPWDNFRNNNDNSYSKH